MKVFYAALGLVYAVVILSVVFLVVQYFDQAIPIPLSQLAQWGIILLIPTAVMAVIEKLLPMLAPREHESIFNDSPMTSVVETVSLLIPNAARGVLYGLAIIILNYVVKAATQIYFLKDVADVLGVPVFP